MRRPYRGGCLFSGRGVGCGEVAEEVDAGGAVGGLGEEEALGFGADEEGLEVGVVGAEAFGELVGAEAGILDDDVLELGDYWGAGHDAGVVFVEGACGAGHCLGSPVVMRGRRIGVGTDFSCDGVSPDASPLRFVRSFADGRRIGVGVLFFRRGPEVRCVAPTLAWLVPGGGVDVGKGVGALDDGAGAGGGPLVLVQDGAEGGADEQVVVAVGDAAVVGGGVPDAPAE